ncbi:hypothetical protein B0O99DRAFT_169277 [Bisporella sp. PMI_857]|nr:hypothetical protein B0O99DRAFT_169277 [Bisporella sp. PMI_857]
MFAYKARGIHVLSTPSSQDFNYSTTNISTSGRSENLVAQSAMLARTTSRGSTEGLFYMPQRPPRTPLTRMDEAEAQILHEAHHSASHPARDMPPQSPPAKTLPLSPQTINSFDSPLARSTGPQNPMEALNLQVPRFNYFFDDGEDKTNERYSSLSSGKFSDFTIVHGARRWRAHKVIVASQSVVLESMIENLTDTSTLNLTTHDSDAVVLMMEYLYTGTYTTPSQPPDFSLKTHISVFVLASTLSITGLQSLSAQLFTLSLSSVSDLEVYFQSVRQIYAVTSCDNPQLRLAVVEAAVLEIRSLVGQENVRRAFLEVTSEVGEFQTDIYTYLVDNPTRGVEIETESLVLCEECGPQSSGYSYTRTCKGCGVARTIEFS